MKNEVPDFEAMLSTLKRDAIRYAKRAGVNFFQDSFYNQGFTDAVLELWQGRANDVDPGRKILIKSASLLNSVRVLDSGPEHIEYGSDEPSAEIHNDGGVITVPVTEKSRKYFWFMFRATGREMWKDMALTKKTKFKIHMPARRFVGHSETFMGQLDDWLALQLTQRFKQL